MPQETASIVNLVAALIKAQASFVPVEKKKTATVLLKTGGSYKYRYADLSDVLAMAIKRLSEQQIVLLQPNIMVDGHLRVCTRLLHASGEWMMSDGIRLSESGDPQDFGKHSTYFRRYDACSFLGIAPDEDQDVQTLQQRTQEPRAQVRVPEAKPQSGPAEEAREARAKLQSEIAALNLDIDAIHSKAKQMFPERKRMGDLTNDELKTLYGALAVQNSDSGSRPLPLSPKLQAMVDAGVVKRAANLTS